MDYEEAFNEKTLQLEPRLQEYCRKKEFNIAKYKRRNNFNFNS